MGRNYVEHNANGIGFHFVFENGDKSFNYDSSEPGLRALVTLVKDQRIPLVDFWEMRDSIMPKGIIPLDGPKGGVLKICIGPMFLHPMKAGAIDVIECFDYEEVTDATFKVCGCGEIHGQIHFDGGFTDLCDKKEEAISYLPYLRKFGYISANEFLKVGEEIENSPL